MTSQPYIRMNPQSSEQLSLQYPFFFMIIQLIPFYYLTAKMASEKESKAREGMKMMGLTDGTYYAALFIFYSIICLLTSAIVTSITATLIFSKVSKTVFFTFSMLYSLSFFGIALIITACLPQKRTSSVAATLFHIVSYYISFTIWNSEAQFALQATLSIFPNTCMSQSIKQFFWQNLNT
jgi:ATP-binding cassette, subfamily A (ABC1), member 3